MQYNSIAPGHRIEAACLWILESSLGPRQYHATKCQCCCRQSEVAVDARQSSNSRCGRCNRVVAACAPGPSRIPNASLPVPRLIWSSPCVVAIHLAGQPAIASIQYVRLASDHCLISFFKKKHCLIGWPTRRYSGRLGVGVDDVRRGRKREKTAGGSQNAGLSR